MSTGQTGRTLEYFGFGECLARSEQFRNITIADGSYDVIRGASNGIAERYIARDLQKNIARRLGIAEEEIIKRLQFYSSVDSPLDTDHVDGFFDFYDEDGEMFTIKLDISAEDKDEINGAYIVYVDCRKDEDDDTAPGLNGEKPPYGKMIGRHSFQIARRIQRWKEGKDGLHE